jgi:hypothetical protein
MSDFTDTKDPLALMNRGELAAAVRQRDAEIAKLVKDLNATARVLEIATERRKQEAQKRDDREDHLFDSLANALIVLGAEQCEACGGTGQVSADHEMKTHSAWVGAAPTEKVLALCEDCEGIGRAWQ